MTALPTKTAVAVDGTGEITLQATQDSSGLHVTLPSTQPYTALAYAIKISKSGTAPAATPWITPPSTGDGGVGGAGGSGSADSGTTGSGGGAGGRGGAGGASAGSSGATGSGGAATGGRAQPAR